MKIIRDSKIYVQAKDIAVLIDAKIDIPNHVVKELFKDYEYEPGSRTKNLDRFLCFDSIDAISFFRSQDWIIDLDKVNPLDTSDCIELLRLNLERKRELLTAIENVISEETRNKLIDRSILIDRTEEQLKEIVCLKVADEPLPQPQDIQEPSKLGKFVNGFMKKIGYKK